MNSKLKAYVLASVVGFACSSTVAAQSALYSVALGGSYDYWTSIYPKAALQFATTTDSTITDFQLYGYRNGTLAGNISFKIFSNDAGNPGSEVASLGTFDSASLGLAVGNAGYFGLSSLSVALAPSTTYWLVADFSGLTWGGSYLYLNRNTSTVTATALGYQYLGSGTGLWYASTGNYLAGSVTAVSSTPPSVPEPTGAVAAVGLAMAGLYQLRRRMAKWGGV